MRHLDILKIIQHTLSQVRSLFLLVLLSQPHFSFNTGFFLSLLPKIDFSLEPYKLFIYFLNEFLIKFQVFFIICKLTH